MNNLHCRIRSFSFYIVLVLFFCSSLAGGNIPDYTRQAVETEISNITFGLNWRSYITNNEVKEYIVLIDNNLFTLQRGLDEFQSNSLRNLDYLDYFGTTRSPEINLYFKSPISKYFIPKSIIKEIHVEPVDFDGRYPLYDMYFMGAGAVYRLAGDDAKVDGNEAGRSFGYGAGIGAELKLSGTISLRHGIFFAPAHNRFEPDKYKADNTKRDTWWKINYLTVPMMLQANIGGSELSDFFIALGGYASYKISADYETKHYTRVLDNAGNVLSVTTTEHSGSLDDIKDVDYGFAGGFGYRYKDYLIECRYMQGFSNIPDIENFDDINNQILYLYLGYRFFTGQ